MRKKLNTMTELSDAIGISRPTLSRYFQNPSSVSNTTRETIARGLEKFDYTPSFFARNLNRKKTRVLGIVIPSIHDRFYTTLVEEIEKHAKGFDYTVIIQNSNGDRELEMSALEQLRSMNAEGVIIAPVGTDHTSGRFEAISKDLSLVFMDSQPSFEESQFPFVGTDNRQSVRLLVDYLCRTGTPPVFMGMPMVNTNTKERLEAYLSHMRELGHEPTIITSDNKKANWNFEEYAYSLLKSKFAQGLLVDATILCANDRLAIGALRAANEFGLFKHNTKSTANFRVAGHDNYPLSDFLWPTLTTASQDTKEMARVAFELFTEQSIALEHDSTMQPEVCLLQAELILRDSA